MEKRNTLASLNFLQNAPFVIMPIFLIFRVVLQNCILLAQGIFRPGEFLFIFLECHPHIARHGFFPFGTVKQSLRTTNTVLGALIFGLAHFCARFFSQDLTEVTTCVGLNGIQN